MSRDSGDVFLHKQQAEGLEAAQVQATEGVTLPERKDRGIAEQS